MGERPNYLDRENFSPLGDHPVLALGAKPGAEAYRDAQAILIGLDRDGLLPVVEPQEFDILLTIAPNAPRPWVSTPAHAFEAKVQALQSAVHRTPHAASMLRQVLRVTEHLSFPEGLIVESFAYSALLGGGEFRAWREAGPTENANANPGSVDFARQDDHVAITLTQPDTRNAMTAAMRDALCEALIAVLDDPSAPSVTLRGDGACFSVGGDLAEFGANPDFAEAHSIRTLRSVARLIHDLGDRIEVVFHGACIGSGLEGPAAAARRTALEGAFFQLPELSMGLIPGAGGTITIPRAIGRHRAFLMMLGGARVSAATALDWGLVHKIIPHA
jgi:hypothetical protein